MFELNKSNGIMADEFITQIRDSLGQEAETWARRPVISIVSTDIDVGTTKEEVRDAIPKEFDRIQLQKAAIITLRKTYSGAPATPRHHQITVGGSAQIIASRESKNRLDYILYYERGTETVL